MFNPVELELPLDGEYYVASASRKYYILDHDCRWKVFFGKKPSAISQYNPLEYDLLDYDYIFQKDVAISVITSELEKFIAEAQNYIGDGYNDWLTVLKGFNRVDKINKLVKDI